jgi:hypothetical protein
MRLGRSREPTSDKRAKQRRKYPTDRLSGRSRESGALVDALKIPFVIVPLVNNHSNQHSFDENIRVGHLLDGVRSFTGLLRALAAAMHNRCPQWVSSAYPSMSAPAAAFVGSRHCGLFHRGTQAM